VGRRFHFLFSQGQTQQPHTRTLSLRVNSPPIQRFPFARGNVRAYDQPCQSGITCKATGLNLQGHRFDPETARLLGIAFEMALVVLERTDGTLSPTRDVVAKKIIDRESRRTPAGASVRRRHAGFGGSESQRPRSSSASRRTAGASGFLNFSQSGERPDL